MAKLKARWWESRLNLGFLGTVVTGVVVGIILLVFGLIPVGRWVVAAWIWLIHPVRLQLVVLVVMIGALVAVAVSILLKLREPPPPPWMEYRHDQFLGIVWRWSYAGNHLQESSITPFCPQCETRLRGEQHGRLEMTTSFICDECRFRRDLPGTGNQVIDRVGRLIEREANQRVARPRP